MSSETVHNFCWNRIGVWGDVSCPELDSVSHCHNCQVHSAAGRSLLERPGSDDYLDEWTRIIARPEQAQNADIVSVVLFRMGGEWLALPTPVFSEVIEDRVIHSMPHRSSRVFLGLVNIRGEIQLCFSLAAILGLSSKAESDSMQSHIVYKRMIVIRQERDSWVFPVDEVYGVHHFDDEELEESPVTISKTDITFTTGLVAWNDRSVGLLDVELLFNALKRSAV